MTAHFNSLQIGQTTINALKAKMPGVVLEERWQTDRQATITVKLDQLPEVVRTLYYDHDGWLSTMVGNDERSLNGTFGLYYVLSMEGEQKSHLVVHAMVPEDSPEFPSVTPKVPAAVWYEREVRDMFGLHPVGLPDARRLVLPDDWPEGLYPLRKDSMDYRFRPQPTTNNETYPFINDAQQETSVVPLGPLHVTSDEPGHFRLFVDGEDIIDADYRMFYVHRGMEKLAETRMGYNEVTFLADRVCGICGYAHSVAYANSVENALGIHVPLARTGDPRHPAGDRTAAQPFAEPRAGLPFHRFRLRLHAVLPRARKDHGARRNADRPSQDLRDEPDRRRAARHFR